tara:strand:+ start:539 stop:652 length:114 start_codon:yes stop_codon:yes gene_type:complete
MIGVILKPLLNGFLKGIGFMGAFALVIYFIVKSFGLL